MTSILDLAEDIADELSLNRPSALVSVTDNSTAQKIFRHMVRSCRMISGRYDWQVLRREKTHTTLAAAAQTGAIPTDFLRFVPETFYNRTTRWTVDGPVTSAEWQYAQTGMNARVNKAFYQRGNTLYLTPTPAAGETIAYEYITKYIGTDTTAATERTTFTVDTDIPYFDDELVILGTVWRYRKAEGLDYSEEYRDFELRLADLIKMDGGRRVLDMNPCPPMKARGGVSVGVIPGSDVGDLTST